MKVRVRRKPVSDMNVVPYIDVMLVLLIIFMVTAPMLVQGVRVDVPKVNSAPLTIDEKNQHLIIALTADGQALIERGDEEPAKVADSGITSYVTGILDSDPGLQVLLRADQNVLYGRVMGVMSSLQAAGMDSVGLITEAPDE
ncbi:protein TolR [Reinekea marinisedimentorum]|uniref:Tol-Pal system protein TolR n=1 Tax=Reinekea marinisedimentorum TaxID=230495 RepID=A0A4R3I664_9GAMM|nr:protein TolR [Reinekea marinisedimentorum]TCS40783.1 biopolymer transport protein TolR [Reinekea marinisedimentorum]